MKCASLFTYEIDEKEIALEDINRQLVEKITLEENSIGIIMCHPEFILSGTLKYICENLPFEVVGITTASQAVNGEAGELILTLFVMTSDDVTFRTGFTESLLDGLEQPTRDAYKIASEGMNGEPKLALRCPPALIKYPGDAFPGIWSEILPNTPNFGTFAVDDTVEFETSETIYKEQTSKEKMSFVLCYGNINPRFLVSSLPDDNLLQYKGEFTKAQGQHVCEINNINAYQYFEELGLGTDGVPSNSFLFLPFFIDFRKSINYDGIRVMRVLLSFTDEGAAVFRGNMEEGSHFTLSRYTAGDVNATTIELMEKINKMENVNGLLSFSCIVRRMVLGAQSLDELENVKNSVNQDIPFMAGYACGEICPTTVKEGAIANRYHNYSVVCLII